ncbi:MAG: hypothetical protein BGO51_10840 [Rhodospirillales bacterium 69-11]|nr:hypothetical protein [Rhodospirillales bacterium]OJW29537.1 MAG: hypothetical protein BGO51_10840 [Rhodospirillales bacterium 69-11]
MDAGSSDAGRIGAAEGWRALRLMALGGVAVLGALWAWIILAPLAFMDPEYAAWRAKQVMLARCDLGDLLILGDSRAAVGIIPADLPVRASNLAVGGGKPVEAWAALERALRCPALPKRVVLSFDAVHFMRADLFWERAVRFGWLDWSDLRSLRADAVDLGDATLAGGGRFAALGGWWQDALHVIRAPPLYVGSVVQGGLALRWIGNRRALAAALASRGQYFFGTAAGSDAVAVDGHLAVFEPAPVLDRAFDRLISTLTARGVAVAFVSLPINEATARAVRPEVRAAFAAYLARYERRYPGFRVLGAPMPAWPGRWFGDAFSHLNPEGAARFTAALAACLGDQACEDGGVQPLASRAALAAGSREGWPGQARP